MIQKVLVVTALVFGILAALSVTVLSLNGGQEAGIGVFLLAVASLIGRAP